MFSILKTHISSLLCKNNCIPNVIHDPKELWALTLSFLYAVEEKASLNYV